MNSVHLGSRRTSTAADLSDLDGYSVPGDYNYSMQSHYNGGDEDFGFDPPRNSAHPKIETFSPPTFSDPLQLTGWSGFDDSVAKDAMIADNPVQTMEPGAIYPQVLNDSVNAVSRFGQVTPPRSDSAISDDNKKLDEISSKPNLTERRKRPSKSSPKEEAEPTSPQATGRKRRNSRKSSTAKDEQDEKRKQSLEKNRLAAAKCRVNKKEKTEQLQRNSHEKAVHNAFLKEQVMRMKEEVQQMNALLLAHANCEGCKSPEEIQKHLSNLGNEFFANHMSPMNYDYVQLNMDEMSRLVQDPTARSDYFSNYSASPPGLNPPLPDFDRAAEFEVHTPMQTD